MDPAKSSIWQVSNWAIRISHHMDDRNCCCWCWFQRSHQQQHQHQRSHQQQHQHQRSHQQHQQQHQQQNRAKIIDARTIGALKFVDRCQIGIEKWTISHITRITHLKLNLAIRLTDIPLIATFFKFAQAGGEPGILMVVIHFPSLAMPKTTCLLRPPP